MAGEGTRHRLAFARYWGAGQSRSIDRLHELLRAEGGPSLRTLYEWSARYHWQDRVADLERQARRSEDEARVTVMREMSDRHAREALLLQQKGAEWLVAVDPATAGPEAGIRALSEGIRLERLVQGIDSAHRGRTQHQIGGTD